MLFKVSPSSINLMNDCPRCFWLDRHRVWKRPSSPFPTLPSGMDRILKDHFDKFMAQGKLPPELCSNDSCSGLKLFDNRELLAKWRNILRGGISWLDEKGNILFGAVDNILVNDGKLIVLDYKTRGYPLKEDTHTYYQNQMDLYNLLLRKNGHATEDYSVLLFYIPKEVTETGEVIFDTSLVKVPVDVENAEKLFNKALEILNSECPQEKCDWCRGV